MKKALVFLVVVGVGIAVWQVLKRRHAAMTGTTGTPLPGVPPTLTTAPALPSAPTKPAGPTVPSLVLSPIVPTSRMASVTGAA